MRFNVKGARDLTRITFVAFLSAASCEPLRAMGDRSCCDRVLSAKATSVRALTARQFRGKRGLKLPCFYCPAGVEFNFLTGLSCVKHSCGIEENSSVATNVFVFCVNLQ